MSSVDFLHLQQQKQTVEPMEHSQFSPPAVFCWEGKQSLEKALLWEGELPVGDVHRNLGEVFVCDEKSLGRALPWETWVLMSTLSF